MILLPSTQVSYVLFGGLWGGVGIKKEFKKSPISLAWEKTKTLEFPHL